MGKKEMPPKKYKPNGSEVSDNEEEIYEDSEYEVALQENNSMQDESEEVSGMKIEGSFSGNQAEILDQKKQNIPGAIRETLDLPEGVNAGNNESFGRIQASFKNKGITERDKVEQFLKEMLKAGEIQKYKEELSIEELSIEEYLLKTEDSIKQKIGVGNRGGPCPKKESISGVIRETLDLPEWVNARNNKSFKHIEDSLRNKGIKKRDKVEQFLKEMLKAGEIQKYEKGANIEKYKEVANIEKYLAKIEKPIKQKIGVGNGRGSKIEKAKEKNNSWQELCLPKNSLPLEIFVPEQEASLPQIRSNRASHLKQEPRNAEIATQAHPISETLIQGMYRDLIKEREELQKKGIEPILDLESSSEHSNTPPEACGNPMDRYKKHDDKGGPDDKGPDFGLGNSHCLDLLDVFGF